MPPTRETPSVQRETDSAFRFATRAPTDAGEYRKRIGSDA
jgi:hypothetical protein